MARITQLCPVLAAANPSAAAAWSRDKLGFVVRFEMEDYAIVARDGAELHPGRCADRHIAENTSAHVRTDEIEAVHADMAGAADGGRISAVEDRPWGMREFYVWDPDGNLLRFGVPVAAPGAA